MGGLVMYFSVYFLFYKDNKTLTRSITSDVFYSPHSTILLHLTILLHPPILLSLKKLRIQTISDNIIIQKTTFGTIHGKTYLSTQLKIIRLLMLLHLFLEI